MTDPTISAPTAPPLIVLAGATGTLGLLLAYHLRRRGAAVRALVRPKSLHSAEAESLRLRGAEVLAVDYGSVADLTRACKGASCVVSALNGLRDIMVEAQGRLLDGAVAAGVPRFIPSDFSADFTRVPEGSNRNFDLRREFARRLDQAPIQATSVLNGMFADLLRGTAPLVLMGPRLVLYWGQADQPLDFTTMQDTADFTAAAALDPTTPRFLRIAGDVATPHMLGQTATAATGHRFRLLRLGSLGRLDLLIKLTKTLVPAPNDVFPPWQGMQYLRNMLSGHAKLQGPLDNGRYPEVHWTSVRRALVGDQERAAAPEMHR